MYVYAVEDEVEDNRMMDEMMNVVRNVVGRPMHRIILTRLISIMITIPFSRLYLTLKRFVVQFEIRKCANPFTMDRRFKRSTTLTDRVQRNSLREDREVDDYEKDRCDCASYEKISFLFSYSHSRTMTWNGGREMVGEWRETFLRTMRWMPGIWNYFANLFFSFLFFFCDRKATNKRNEGKWNRDRCNLTKW